MDRLCSGTATLGDFCSMAGAGGTGTGVTAVDPAAGDGANGRISGDSLDESLLQPERTKVTKTIEAACFFTASLLVGHHSHVTAPDCHIPAGKPGWILMPRNPFQGSSNSVALCAMGPRPNAKRAVSPLWPPLPNTHFEENFAPTSGAVLFREDLLPRDSMAAA